jgi:hypothetical protein
MKLASLKPSLIFFAIFTSIFFLSCTSENETDSFGFMTADVETVPFASRTGSDFVYALKSESASTTLTVQGSDSDAQIIVVQIANYEGPGTYTLNFNGNNVGSAGLYLNVNRRWGTNFLDGGTGSITITSDNDREVSGNFRFIGFEEDDTESMKSVTNGKFEARFQKITE